MENTGMHLDAMRVEYRSSYERTYDWSGIVTGITLTGRVRIQIDHHRGEELVNTFQVITKAANIRACAGQATFSKQQRRTA